MPSKKQSDSDLLKLLLSRTVGGEAGDWKRLSKKKVSGTDDIAREFENEKLGLKVTINQKPDGFLYADLPDGSKMNAHLPVLGTFNAEAAGAPVCVKSDGLTATHDADPDRNALAETVVRMAMGEEDLPQSDEELETMVAQAGLALANRYSFAISAESGSLYVLITATRFFEEHGCCDDQDGPIRELLPPRMSNAMEATWNFSNPAIKTALDAVKELQRYGFVWNRDFQDYIDSAVTAEITAGLQPDTAPPRDATELADKIVNSLVHQTDLKNEDLGGLAQQAGAALAKRHIFSFFKLEEPMADGLDYNVWIAPDVYYKTFGVNDGGSAYLKGFLPGWDEETPSCWSPQTAMPMGEALRDLQSKGFIWDKEMQNDMDASLTKEILSLQKSSQVSTFAEAAASPAKKKKHPAAMRPAKKKTRKAKNKKQRGFES